MGGDARWMAVSSIYREQVECDVEQFVEMKSRRKKPFLAAGLFRTRMSTTRFCSYLGRSSANFQQRASSRSPRFHQRDEGSSVQRHRPDTIHARSLPRLKYAEVRDDAFQGKR